MIYVPKWDDHWFASYHPGNDDFNDDHGRKDEKHKFKKIVGYLCKVPVSRDRTSLNQPECLLLRRNRLCRLRRGLF